jgi:RHS repeat-associated protein
MFPLRPANDGQSQPATMRRGNRIGSPPYWIDSNGRKIGQQWTLDPTGNWATFKEDPDGDLTWDTEQDRTHNKANELTAIESVTSYLGHDRAGNVTRCPIRNEWEAAHELKYDGWNRLVEVKEGQTVVATYAYDGLNRRVKKVVGSVTRHFYYSRDWQVLEERVGTATTADRQFVWGLRYVDDLVLRVVYQSPANEVLYAVNDANFNVTAVVDDAATPGVIERYVYTPYGATIVVTPDFGDVLSSGPWEYTYAGYRFDAETGLMQVRNRYLHPQLGRWVTRDPIDLEAGLNLYSYAFNSPTYYTDSTGLIPPVDVGPWAHPSIPPRESIGPAPRRTPTDNELALEWLKEREGNLFYGPPPTPRSVGSPGTRAPGNVSLKTLHIKRPPGQAVARGAENVIIGSKSRPARISDKPISGSQEPRKPEYDEAPDRRRGGSG